MRTRLTFFLVLLAGLVLIRESRIAPLASVEDRFASWLNTNSRRRQPERAPLVLVEITEDDLRDAPWPWSPFDYSLAVHTVLSFDPAVLALEPPLAWPKADAHQLSLLHHELLRAPRLLLGAQLGHAAAASPAEATFPVLSHVKGDTAAVPEGDAREELPDETLRLAGALGFHDLPGWDGEDLRRAPLLFRHCGRIVPSFTLQAAMLWFGVSADEVEVTLGGGRGLIVLEVLGGEVRIPVDAGGALAVDFRVPITRVAIGDLLLAAASAGKEEGAAAQTARLKKAFALVAKSDAAAHGLSLNRHGSRGGSYGSSRGEFFAHAIATLQERLFVRRVPLYAEGAFVVAAMGMAWLLLRKGRLWATAFGALVAAGYVLVALGLFAETLIALPLLLPLGLIAFVLALRWLV